MCMKIRKEVLRKIEEVIAHVFPGAKVYIIQRKIVKGCTGFNDFFVAVDTGEKLSRYRVGMASEALDKAVPEHKIGLIDYHALDACAKKDIENVRSRLWPWWIRWLLWCKK